ncbi:MAG: S-layer homology domain-containing protein [Oscillospiraceae bacterium]|nr:S-layer homology domain-containing protein [Oscillospiraceae bacterium]
MKRILAGILALCLALSLIMPTFAADTGSGAVQTVRALGILKGDQDGNTDLSGTVSRAEFAFMLATVSTYKDSVSREGSGYSLYKDVKSGYWASEAIQLAVQRGWMTGFTDGTFRPEQGITLEAACTALLKLLGYDASCLAGSFPQAQLSKAKPWTGRIARIYFTISCQQKPMTAKPMPRPWGIRSPTVR